MISSPAATSAASSDSDPLRERDFFPDEESWALLESARRGDVESVAALYRAHVGAVRRFIRSKVASPDLADDLTSEVFVRMLRSLDGVRFQKGKFRAWLFTIGRNMVFDHAKSRYQRSVTPVSAPDDTGPAEPSAEDLVLRRLARDVVWTRLAQLAPAQRECLYLRFLEGRSVAETALALGRSRTALRQLQLRATRNLAELLAPEEVSA